MTEIGKLNKRIQLQYEAKVSDGMGGFTTTWTNLGDPIWSAIWPTSAKEIAALNSTNLEVTHRIRIRYRSAFKTSWRIKFGERYFSISGKLNPEEKNEYLDLMCKEAE